MERRLILMRHAKSCWADVDLTDHERPLNKRGRKAAPRIGRWLLERDYRPDTVLVSSARRTRQTFEYLQTVMPELPTPSIERALYHAPSSELLARLRALPDPCACAMLIGHEPGLGVLVSELAQAENIAPHCVGALGHFPTAAAAVFTFSGKSWRDLARFSADFVDFARPRDLAEPG